MNLLMISASQRKPSQSYKVGQMLQQQAQQMFRHCDLVDLITLDLSWWDGDEHSPLLTSPQWQTLRPKIAQADAFILISPEWGGMATPILKNFLLMMPNQLSAHKPVLLVSVVSGISGAYPIAELRMNALKNNKLVAIPDHLIVRNVELLTTNTSDELSQKRKQRLMARMQYSVHMLHEYAQALAVVRLRHQNEPFPKQQEYCYGM